MSYSLNALQKVTTTGVINGDTRRLDHSSYGVPWEQSKQQPENENKSLVVDENWLLATARSWV